MIPTRPDKTKRSKTITNTIDNRVNNAGTAGLNVIEKIDTENGEEKKIAGIIGHTILRNRGRGHDVIDPYRVAQMRFRNQLRSRVITSEDAECDSKMSG